MHAVLLWALNAVVGCAVVQSPVQDPATSDLRPQWLQVVPVEPDDGEGG